MIFKKVSPKRCSSTRLIWPEKKKSAKKNLVKGSLLLVARLTILLPLAILVFFSKNSSRRSSSLRQNLGEELSNVLIPLPSCKRPNRIHWLSICTTNAKLEKDWQNQLILKTKWCSRHFLFFIDERYV